jgi:hypothetical protein
VCTRINKKLALQITKIFHLLMFVCFFLLLQLTTHFLTLYFQIWYVFSFLSFFSLLSHYSSITKEKREIFPSPSTPPLYLHSIHLSTLYLFLNCMEKNAKETLFSIPIFSLISFFLFSFTNFFFSKYR